VRLAEVPSTKGPFEDPHNDTAGTMGIFAKDEGQVFTTVTINSKV
jgi:hypothetical protein